MGLTTGKIAEIMFESTKETFESQDQMLSLVDFHEPDAGMFQNAGNVAWYPVEQHAPVIAGWDMTGEETGIIEETYPVILGTPSNDFVRQRIDDMRDKRFWEKRGKASGRRQASELNKLIASAITLQGSIFYRSNEASGYDFIAEAQALMNERQLATSKRHFLLNDRDLLTFASDLAARQTLQGKPDTAWATSQIGQNIAEFDIFTGSFLPNLTGGVDPATTVTGDHSFSPEGGSVNSSTGVVINVDYRIAVLIVAASTDYNIGDKFTISNNGTPVTALGLDDKNDTGEAMTFTIVGKPDSTHIQIYPKPIALDDPALTSVEAAYANIDTQILDTATVDRLNTDSANKVNLFWEKSAVEVIGGSIPAELFSQYDGMKVISDTLSNGQKLYMIYDGDIATLNFRYRLFTWYGITISAPQNCGVAVTY